MPSAPVRILPTPEAIGEFVAERILGGLETARESGQRYLLGSPTGRTPRPVYSAMAHRLAEKRQDLSHLTLVMMDEYLVQGASALQYAPDDAPWSCHYFARVEIMERLNAVLLPTSRLREESVWFPTPGEPEAYDERIAAAGGIDLFLLASGASDGHVAFNPPGSARSSRTRVISLSDDTRRDNLQTFPAFGTLDTVPRYGVSVGVSTITSSRSAVMVVWGAGKRLTLKRMSAAEGYEPDWPATLIHECPEGEIVADQAAAV
ncbi:MAG: 6-phosphogluconolactonase [Gemmatimonadaceae bacterium]